MSFPAEELKQYILQPNVIKHQNATKYVTPIKYVTDMKDI